MAVTTELEMAALVHDLKAPMSVASSAAQLALQAGGKDVSVQLQQILQAMHAMDRMLTMMGAEQTQQGACQFTAQMLRGELMAMAQQGAARKGQKLSIDLSALDGAAMRADYASLCRLLNNLLSNAIKYTQMGGMITLRAQMECSWRVGESRICFIVADNGPGMSREFMRRMYLPFARAKETSHEQGKGLGLAIAKDMVRRMNGTIRVRSKCGKGTVFLVSVPVKMGKHVLMN